MSVTRALQPGSDVLREWRAFASAYGATREYPALVKLSRTAERLAELPEIGRQLTPLRLAIVSSATIDFLTPVLKAALYRIGVLPTIHVTPFGQVVTSLIERDGPLERFLPQITLVSTATAHLPALPSLGASLEDVEAQVDEVCESLLGPCAGFHGRTGSEIVLSNFPAPPWRSSGHLGAKLPGDLTTFIHRVNLALGDRAPRYVHIDDVAALADQVGSEAWFDERYWFLAKQPVSFACVPAYANHLAAIVGAILGRSRKCLVVDLDNTLWGGVIGDDGLAGIQLGEGNPEGEAFLAFQRYLLELKERGVLLAVSSKNDDAIARQPFTDHPDMVLKLDDFVAFKANWKPKSESIRAIANEIDLPLDALVFVDDNPAERAEVSSALPEVAVVDLPDDPAGFVRALDGARLFDVATLTDEDRQRTGAYRGRQQAREALGETTDLRSYLTSLGMFARVSPFEPVAFERITQLINKTNQFNLTTPRVVQADVERMASDAAFLTRTVRLRDRFADHGLISVLFGRLDGSRLVIDAWLMSCRVLGRGVEQLLFNDLTSIARDRGLDEIVGFYKPTSRNGLVKDHYAALGFCRVNTRDEIEEWRLAVAGASPTEALITLDQPKDNS